MNEKKGKNMTQQVPYFSKSFIAAGFFSLALLVTGCDTEKYRQQQERARVEQEHTRIEQEKKEHERIISIYETSDALAQYALPVIKITVKKSSLTLDPWEHMKNAAKTKHIELPVSQEYFDSVNVGTTLDSKFNVHSLFTDEPFSSYRTFISEKKYNTIYCAIKGKSWEQIDEKTYRAAVACDSSKHLLKPYRAKNVLAKNDTIKIPDAFTQRCKVEVESYKSNFTIDITKQFMNAITRMHYTLEFPGFICEKIKPGDVLDRDFVGGSLLFSSSPSMVTFKVKGKK